MKSKSLIINNATAVLLILSLFWITGCISSLTVKKVKDNDDTVTGIRYSLPKPFLLVTPSKTGDGTFTVSVVYFPDMSKIYAINGKTVLGKHKLNVKIADGLLEKISWSPDDTAVSSEAIRVAGELKKAALVQKKADDEAKLAEQKAAQEKINTLKKEVSEKQLALDLALAELSSLESSLPGKPNREQREALRLARLAVQKKHIEWERKEEELKAAQDNANILAKFNLTSDKKNEKTAYGPMLYEIKDTINWDGSNGGIELEPVKWKTSPDYNETTQEKFKTALIIPEPAKKKEVIPKLTYKGPEIFWYTEGPITIKRTFDKEIGEILWTESELEYHKDNTKTKLYPKNFIGSKNRNLIATFEGLKTGDYTLAIRFKTVDAKVEDSPKTTSINFTVIMPPPNPIPKLTATGVEMVIPDKETGKYVITRQFVGKVKSLKFEDSTIAKFPYIQYKPINEFPITMVLKKEQPLEITIKKEMETGSYKLRVVFEYIVQPGKIETGSEIVQFKVPK